MAVLSKTPVHVPIGRLSLQGDLGLPPAPRGLIVFAHGSGSSRHSSRNQYVARVLEQERFATLLIDLLTEEEEALDQDTAHLRFDIEMLARRLVAIVDWLGRHHETATLPIGLFGASTGGGAALVAAAVRQQRVAAVVSRGGRPDPCQSARTHRALSVECVPTPVAHSLVLRSFRSGPGSPGQSLQRFRAPRRSARVTRCHGGVRPAGDRGTRHQSSARSRGAEDGLLSDRGEG